MISPAVSATTDAPVVQQKPFHRPGFPPEYPSVPSPVHRVAPYPKISSPMTHMTTLDPQRTSGYPVVPSPIERTSVYPSMASPVERGHSCPTSPASPCSTASEHDSSLEKNGPTTDSDQSDECDRDSQQYYRNPHQLDHGKSCILSNVCILVCVLVLLFFG